MGLLINAPTSRYTVFMLVAMLPGSFDPPTNGHLNLIHRAASIFDKIYLVVAVNPKKDYLFSGDERLSLMKKLLKDYQNVEVRLWGRLTVDFARETGARVIIRGVRALADFGYEFELAMTYKSLSPDIETIFIPTDPKYFVLRSSAIKEIAMLGGEITSMVPEIVAESLKSRLNGS